MSLHAALTLLLEEYPKASKQDFSGNAVANFVRKEVPLALWGAIGENSRYIVRGSAGQSNWAKAPWAAVYDRFVTDTAQEGYYVVYLVREDFAGVYLSLNQGITATKKQYGADAKQTLQARAADFVARLGSLTAGFDTGPIDLAASTLSGLSSYYEIGSICSKYYPAEALSEDAALTADLRAFVHLYFVLASREAQLFERADAEEDEEGLHEEDLRKLREHKRIERNRKLARQAKLAHGYTCAACGFDFREKYGAIGDRFIEAHHLTPISDLKGQRLKLSPKLDFTVLCSNCHRMIHRTALPGSVEEFRKAYLRRGS